MRTFSTLVFACLFGYILQAQPSFTAADCLGAIPICQGQYIEQNGFLDAGQIEDEIQDRVTCLYDQSEAGITWYVFTANTDTDFGFLITPNNLDDDYDWAVFDITDRSCSDLKTDAANLLVSCNSTGSGRNDSLSCNGITGADGSSWHHIQNGGCNSGDTPLNALIRVQKEHTYVLAVQNWTFVGFGEFDGYTIDILGDLMNDFTRPTIESIEPPTGLCSRNLYINFSEPIACEALSQYIDDLQFELMDMDGNNHPFRISSEDCLRGQGGTKRLILRLNQRLSKAGSYFFNIKIDEQATSAFFDRCGNPLFSGSQIGHQLGYPFEVSVDNSIDVDITASEGSLCAGDPITLTARAISRFADIEWFHRVPNGLNRTPIGTGNEIIITETGVYSAVASFGCRSGEDSISFTCRNLQLNNTPTNKTKLFPNPAQDYLQFNFEQPSVTKKIQILDLQGKVLFQDSTTNRQLQLQLPSHWSTGIYIAQITTNQSVETIRFIRE